MHPLLLLETLSELPPYVQFQVSAVSVLVIYQCATAPTCDSQARRVSQAPAGTASQSCDRNDNSIEIFYILGKEKRKIIQEITRVRHDPL